MGPTQPDVAGLMVWWLPLTFAWLAGVITISILIRRRRGRPIFPKTPPDALYAERFGSGRSDDDVPGRIGGARNCLVIAVTRDELTICPFFPFNLGFLPNMYGLEHRVPRGSIRSVERRPGLLGDRVLIAFETDKAHAVELEVRDARAFVRALGGRW